MLPYKTSDTKAGYPMKSNLSNVLTVLGVVALALLIVVGMGYMIFFMPDYHDDPEYRASQPDPEQVNPETQAYREQLQRDYEREEWASHPQYVPKLTAQAKSPDGKWYCWINNITPYIDGYEQATYDEIHVKSSDGTEYQLDECDYTGYRRMRWLSKPVFSVTSNRVAVFECDELGTGRIFIWSLPSGELKIVDPSRGDLKRIYSDKKGVFRIGPEKHDYSTD